MDDQDRDSTQFHQDMMNQAMIEAERALSLGEVAVGCVIVRHSLIVARGSNATNVTKNPLRHAEVYNFLMFLLTLFSKINKFL